MRQMSQLMGEHGVLLAPRKVVLETTRQADRRPPEAKSHRTVELAGANDANAAAQAETPSKQVDAAAIVAWGQIRCRRAMPAGEAGQQRLAEQQSREQEASAGEPGERQNWESAMGPARARGDGGLIARRLGGQGMRTGY
jgi:hypothetical protein